MNDKDDFTDWLIAREECIEMELDDEELKATRKLNGADKSTADEMFEELGYKKITEHEFTEPEYGETTELILYRLILYRDEVKRLDIEFWNDKSISKTCNYDVGYITMQELKAINKKCKELGWVDE